MNDRDKHLIASWQDLTEDFEELNFLASSARERLVKARKDFATRDDMLPSSARKHVLGVLDPLIASHDQLLSDIQSRAEALGSSEEKLREAIVFKKATARTLRTLAGITGSTLASADWQSPSFDASGSPEAGRQVGRIIGTANDYKRDFHLDAGRVEREFRRAYGPWPAWFPFRAHFTSSGMAAFTTILDALLLSGKCEGNVLMGASSYFENKGLLRKAFRHRLFTVNEFDVEGILEAVKQKRPSAIFLDTLCNTDTLAILNLAELIPRLVKTVGRETYLVLDNSALGPLSTLRASLPRLPGRLKVVVFESLNKFYEFGFDRVTGGVIWTPMWNPIAFDGFRMNLGTILPDASTLSLPPASATHLERRMRRIGRNAQILAEALDVAIRESHSQKIEALVYPGLPSYAGYAWTREWEFCGASLVVKFHEQFQTPAMCKKFLERAIALAKRAGVDMIAGTSFGLNTTRIYLTALHSRGEAIPFLRLSAGTETRVEVERLVEVFRKVMKSF